MRTGDRFTYDRSLGLLTISDIFGHMNFFDYYSIEMENITDAVLHLRSEPDLLRSREVPIQSAWPTGWHSLRQGRAGWMSSGYSYTPRNLRIFALGMASNAGASNEELHFNLSHEKRLLSLCSITSFFVFIHLPVDT